MDDLWVAVATWADLESEVRGVHMKILLSALQTLTLINTRRGGKLGWRSILYILEARAMRLRHRASPDTPTKRAEAAFTIRIDDSDVKNMLDNPIRDAARRTDEVFRYEPYPYHVRVATGLRGVG